MKPAAYRRLAEVEDRHWWYLGMRANAQRLLAGEPLGRVLDVGCGTGGWLTTLPALGTGVDLSPLPLQLAHARLDGRVARASAGALPFPGAAFDTVTCLDVLYHLGVASDSAALAEIARVLVPGGRLLVQVPAYNWLRSGHDDDVATRERYTAPVLRGRVTAAGLTVERVTYGNTLMLPAAVVWRLVDRLRGPGEARDLALPPRAVNAGARFVLTVEGWLQRRIDLPAGLSVLAIARRPAGSGTQSDL